MLPNTAIITLLAMAPSIQNSTPNSQTAVGDQAVLELLSGKIDIERHDALLTVAVMDEKAYDKAVLELLSSEIDIKRHDALLTVAVMDKKAYDQP